jgi:hypothetical protein
MFSKPKTTTYVAPAEPIDVNEKYLLKLSEIKDEGTSKYADPADADPPHNLRWVFRMARLDRDPVLDIDGHVYEHHDYTSNRTGKSKTKTAKARSWAEALMGRPLEDHEIDDSLPVALQEKVAVALFEEVERGGQDGSETYMKLKILKLSPYKGGAGQAGQPKAAPAPAPKEPEPVAAAAGAKGDEPW